METNPQRREDPTPGVARRAHFSQVSLVKVSLPKHYSKGLLLLFTEKVCQKRGRKRQIKPDLTPIKNENNIEIIIRIPSDSTSSFLMRGP